MAKNAVDPCVICEEYIKGEPCAKTYCPVAVMINENNMLKAQVERLKLEMTYMNNPCAIGDRNDMGW